ncbi:aromatic ring-hydroxylating oxygenase subunit alpha [Streptomyces tsukubensis]|uniref:aromatic ring-hydroxylating oxygenase subunit alpha n=1 Tax=Streptomyces tsukubensis TaxID=83656 RepID=UPI00368F519C
MTGSSTIRGADRPYDETAHLPQASGDRGLPGRAYTDAEIHEREREHLWRGGWVCAGRAALLPEPGDQTSVEVAGVGVLVVRDGDGALRTYLNACRHRGHELVQRGCTLNRSTIWCAYHAWVYRLDGSLRKAPRFDVSPDDELGLLPVRSVVRGGWLFVNLSGTADDFAATVGNLSAELAPYQPSELVVWSMQEYAVAANWKLLFENYLECYHCPSVHPELSRVQRTDGGEDLAATGRWLGGFMDLRNDAVSMSPDGSGAHWSFPLLDEDRVRQVRYHALLPNLFVTAHHEYVLTHRLEPIAPDRTRVVCEWLVSPDFVADGFGIPYAVDFWSTTNRQDWAACESVQRGVSAPGYVPGRLARHEDMLRRFHRMVAEAMEPDPPPVAPGWVRRRAGGS